MDELDNIELSVICSGTTILERFEGVGDEIVQSGFNVIAEVNCEIEGSNVLSATSEHRSRNYQYFFCTKFLQTRFGFVDRRSI